MTRRATDPFFGLAMGCLASIVFWMFVAAACVVLR